MRKKIKIMLIITIVMILAITTKANATTGKANQETIRIRKEATTNSGIVTLISLNEEVEILSEEGEWYKVKYKTYSGYIRKDMLNVENASQNVTENKDTENTGTENTNTVTVKSENNQNTENQVSNESSNTENTTESAQNENTEITKEDKTEEKIEKQEQETKQETKQETNLEGLTLAELKVLAKEKEIKGYSTMKKADLIAALK